MTSVFTRKRILAVLALLWLAGMLIYGASAWLFPGDPVLGRWYNSDPFENDAILEFRPGGKLKLLPEYGSAKEGTWKRVTVWHATVADPLDPFAVSNIEFFSEAEAQLPRDTPLKMFRCQNGYSVEFGGKTWTLALCRDQRGLYRTHAEWGRQEPLHRWIQNSIMNYWLKGKPTPSRGLRRDFLTQPPEAVLTPAHLCSPSNAFSQPSHSSGWREC